MERRTTIAAMIASATLASQALAAEYCVTCEGPAAMYRCMVAGTPDGPGTNASHSLYCISEMAARGRHENCSVSRGAPHPCPGLVANVAQPAGKAPAPPPDAAAEAPKPDAAVSPAGASAPPGKVPRTVEELANQTVQSSKEGIQKAGEAIGGTAKKAGEQIGNAGSAIGNAASNTWACLSSFFTNCSSEPEPPPAPSATPHEPGAPPPRE
jgi:hypothetical protein